MLSLTIAFAGAEGADDADDGAGVGVGVGDGEGLGGAVGPLALGVAAFGNGGLTLFDIEDDFPPHPVRMSRPAAQMMTTRGNNNFGFCTFLSPTAFLNQILESRSIRKHQLRLNGNSFVTQQCQRLNSIVRALSTHELVSKPKKTSKVCGSGL
jgi:hypothetical protein